MDINREVERLVGARASVNPSRPTLVQEAIAHREALVSVSGALATWTSPESTGRRPQDTYIVDRPEIHDEV
ncbi:MAG TPA: phosphoenolpyruvate carboxykinase (ATP), partial [Candidatus Bipolaricaulis anaerobius]|nr:phosphoenolpyruvate carboxykinase (ATP) [Candidatus Bipolaricaulis anaerobius]